MRLNERLTQSLERPRPHGTRTRYQQGCRCFECRRVCAAYQMACKQRQREGVPSNPFVPVKKARKHLKKLSRSGIGLRVVAEVSGIAKSSLAAITSERYRFIRAANERAILAVTKSARVDGTKVLSERTFHMERVTPPLLALIEAVPEVQQCTRCPQIIVVREFLKDGVMSEYRGADGECFRCWKRHGKQAPE
jgi:hypothetical protein